MANYPSFSPGLSQVSTVISDTQTKLVTLLTTQQLKMTTNQKQEKERFSPENVGSG